VRRVLHLLQRMEEKLDRPQRTKSELRLRRLRLVVDAETVARRAGFTVWKLYRIERAPGRARLADVHRLAEALAQFEQAAAAVAAGRPNEVTA
jgi:predicted transcriptional regulator